MAATERTFKALEADDGAPEAGIFTWDIAENLVFADPAVAALFGLESERTIAGLPIDHYLNRVHPDDRPLLARTISEAIIAEAPQQSSYRVMGANGHYRQVSAFARAFRDKAGHPKLYSGIIVPDEFAVGEVLVHH